MFFSYITTNSVNDSSQTNIKLSFVGMKASAQSQPGEGGGTPSCLSFGYKNWNAANPLLASGYDCLCQDRDRVKNPCQ